MLSSYRRTWYPVGLRLLVGKGAGKDEEGPEHALGDKTVADVCEALIGAAFIEHDKTGSFRPDEWNDAVKAVTRLVDSPNHAMLEYVDYYKAYSKPAYQTATPTASQRDLAAQVEGKHPYRFHNPTLARCAFNHPSQPFITERLPSYQRLEFLGDSLLDMACVTYLFYKHPNRDPQWLTEHKMAMVSNRFMAALCVKLGFHKHLRVNNQKLQHDIRLFVEDITEAERQTNGSRDYWTAVNDPPKVGDLWKWS